MASKRNRSKPPIHLSIWRQEGELWWVERSNLERIIRGCGIPEYTIRCRMGAGYAYLQRLLGGERLDGWAISHVEWGLKPGLSELEVQAEKSHRAHQVVAWESH